MLQGSFQCAWSNFSYSQSHKIKVTQVKTTLSWFMNNDFLGSVLYPLEQALGKTKCQRN